MESAVGLKRNDRKDRNDHCNETIDEMVRWVNSALFFAMSLAFLAIFAVKLCCGCCPSLANSQLPRHANLRPM